MVTLTGYGYENGRSGKFGNHYITIFIEIPSNLSDREQELYAELK